MKTKGNWFISVQVLENGKPIDHTRNREENYMTKELEEQVPADKLAKVKYSVGMTVNLGDYQSVRIDVGIELPVHADGIEGAYNTGAEFCGTKLQEEIDAFSVLKK